MHAIRVHGHGGPEAMTLDELPTLEPGRGQVRVRVASAGVNFIDVYHRTGLYPLGLPATLGKEGSGVVEAVGEGVSEVAAGDRVCFWDADGSYSTHVLLAAERAIPVPASPTAGESGTQSSERKVGLDVAAALPLQGMTADYLTRTIRPLSPGDMVLVHAAAGGVGLLAVQLAKRAGARVFGTCSTAAKAARVVAAGAERAIRYDETDFVAEVLAATGGRGVDLAIDGVGKATFEGSVRATRLRGHVILFGQASGAPEPIEPRKLLGSRTLTCASLFHYAAEREEMLERAARVFNAYRAGDLEVRIERVLPLAEAAEAHRLLEGRETSGKLLLEMAP
jgi:NADPH2:quinone reductase